MPFSDAQIIDLLGGTNFVAKLCKIAPAAVSQWKVNGIPHSKMVFLGAELEKKSYGLIKRQDLFPESWFMIWPELLPQGESWKE